MNSATNDFGSDLRLIEKLDFDLAYMSAKKKMKIEKMKCSKRMNLDQSRMNIASTSHTQLALASTCSRSKAMTTKWYGEWPCGDFEQVTDAL